MVEFHSTEVLGKGSMHDRLKSDLTPPPAPHSEVCSHSPASVITENGSG